MFWEAPLTVGLHFLGVEEDDMALLRQYSVAHTVNIWGRPTPEEQIAVAHAVGNFWQLSGRIVEKMRATPDGPGWMRYTIRKQQEHPDVVTAGAALAHDILEIGQRAAGARIDRDGDLVMTAVLEPVDDIGQEGDRQVVDAIEAGILEHADGQ